MIVNGWDLLLLLLIAAALALAVRGCLRDRKRGGGCPGCADGCAGCDLCARSGQEDGGKRP